MHPNLISMRNTVKKFVCLILLFVLSLCGMEIFAAQAKSKTLTKRYKNEKLIVVLNDLCKRNDYTLNILDEIDTEKRITAEFKNASVGSVLRKVLDKEYQGKVRKGVLTISRKPVPPQTYTVTATTPSRIEENDTVVRTIYTDTVFTVTCMMKTVEEKTKAENEKPKAESGKKKKENAKDENWKGHNLQILLGGGYGSMGYNLKNDGKEIGFFGGSAQLRYLYYFSPNWGIGLGAGFAYYSSTGTLNTTTVFTPDIHDSDASSGGQGEAYEHHVKTHDWQEKQNAYMLDVPVLIQCSYPTKTTLKNGPLKIYADLGADLGFALAASRQLTGGSIDHTGWYEAWNLELSHVDDHDFYTEQASDFGSGKQALKLKMPAVGLMADFGLAIPLSAKLDLLIGLYGTYTVNNICATKQDIGWKQTDATGYKMHDFMNEYAGLIGTQYASAVHPWQAGMRIGINFHSRPEKKAKKSTPPPATYTRINVCDTTATLQERVVTTIKAVTVAQIKRITEKSVIWFEKNSTEPQLKPADILVKLADILKENPTQKILVTGHASREGGKERNQRLSEERAQVIIDMLRQLGVNDDQMQSRGEGIDRDYIQGDHNISLDRRVEITPVE